MDANFLEFFGQMLIQAAKGQRQMDQFSQLLQQGFNSANIPGFSDYLQRTYGLKNISKESNQYTQLIKKAQADFFTAYGEFIELMGFVPGKKYRQLEEKYQALEERYQDLEKKMIQLKKGFDEEGDPKDHLTDQLTNLIEQQNSEFTKTIKSLATLFNSKESS